MPASVVKLRKGAGQIAGPAQEHQPDWVLIELGGNDGLRGFAPAITRDNLTKMVALTKAQQVKPC